jgi:hypothetical protein
MPFWTQSHDLQRRAEWLASQTFVVLAIQVPKANEKTPQSAEQFFAALHGTFRSDPVVQEHISFEIVAKKDAITFYVFTPLHLRDFIEGQLYAQYPDLNIRQISDYTKDVQLEGQHVATSKIQLTKEDVYPIKTFTASEVDPLAGITAVLSGLEENEQIWFQMVSRPVSDEWQSRGVKYVQDIRAGKNPATVGVGVASKMGRFLLRVVQEAAVPGSGTGATKPDEPVKLSSPQEAALKGIESKITKLGFETIFRTVVITSDTTLAKSRTQALLAAFKQYNTTNLNGFIGSEIKIDDYPSWEKFITREFEEKGNILNIEELASVYHFPSQAVETSAIAWAGSKKGEAPFNLPLKDLVDAKELTVLGRTDYRNKSAIFGIKLDDRKRHIYVIGKSGTGKSTLLENMIIDDIVEGRGVVLVDPHGELADKVVESIPENRIKDVIILDPADRDFPIAFNLLEKVDDDFKGMVASGFVGIFKKIFGNSWGPRLEYILRNTVLALLDTDNATMLGIPRMLTENAYREQVIGQIKDTVIKDFWVNEWGGMDQKQRAEAIGPILNKVGQFLSTSTIRNIVGQPKSTIDVRRIMDEQKILIVNLSKGKIGEDNMALLGAMIITKVQLAAMSRANVKASERPDCFLYVDEFQNFATESFASILSEARKYNLGLTIAHQYIAQMSEEVKDAVIGNVGTLITFRIGGPDAESLVKEYAPVFDANDLINLPKAHIYIKLLVDGIAAPAFSAQTLPPKEISGNFRSEVVAFSREHYARTREEVENMIDETGGYKQKREAQEAAKKAQEVLTRATAVIGPQGSSNAGMAQRVAPTQSAAPAPRPVVQAAPVIPQARVVQVQRPEPVAMVEKTPIPEQIISEPIAEIPQIPVEEGVERVPRPEKPLKIMDGWVYKEVSQKGGMKWYLGEKEEVVKERLEEKRRLKELGVSEKNDEVVSPVPVSSPEQRANEEVVEVAPVEPPMGMPVMQAAPISTSLNLEEGKSISL